jgi:hypothetical protein
MYFQSHILVSFKTEGRPVDPFPHLPLGPVLNVMLRGAIIRPRLLSWPNMSISHHRPAWFPNVDVKKQLIILLPSPISFVGVAERLRQHLVKHQADYVPITLYHFGHALHFSTFPLPSNLESRPW